jgi:hypothetical protein
VGAQYLRDGDVVALEFAPDEARRTMSNQSLREISPFVAVLLLVA